ncbi:hypothetical protein PHJA_000997500 [Phtheirospermum japonicum]|uniref:Uncharacterized protein n=1 Tax=Phtheirospermum japonicum TaxID=374723 RepID=A0A830BUC2_9LAMI|nr:hypothetical protein PHJA_000997500 [Phtheirospermum japonicum]
MAGREVREYTNLTDPKDKKSGKGKDRIDDEEITFQRMVAKMQEVAGERGGYLHGRGALDSDDLLYLKEQMEAEEDAERLLRRTEKRAFAAFSNHKAVAETSPAPVPLPLRVEPKPKSGIRQQDLLKRVLEVKPKRRNVSSPSDQRIDQSPVNLSGQPYKKHNHSVSDHEKEKVESLTTFSKKVGEEAKKSDNPVKSLLVAYESSDDDED